ncbi:MAG: 3-methyl-2-oxobutanoate hydroxymethyltransferase [Fimbriimonas ginsengisoli]|uniref:3-methyl-2-oxobutanoate hydroxymethyltransferase n=1 Tax=Fimbriimonas ginsengisoli TaxID=1005039 RepID=A0A931LR44_FIMGI|nr:3-methyl-2-oxobutanoate hydroxymethyltransferase [Fimbriimonas ginsengisoli]
MPDKVTAPKIRAMKGREPIVCVTAYDAAFGEIVDEAGVDIVLVGDSVGNVCLGYPNTLPVTMSDMVHHTAAAARGVKRALLVADMPFGSYQASPAQAVDSAIALVKAGAEAVKLEGPFIGAIRAILAAGVPVMGHLGLTPQSIHAFGGFRIQGKGEHAKVLCRQAHELEEAGVFSAVLELMPAAVAKDLTESVGYPTIGIGAGPDCDGQVQVLHDLLGFSTTVFKHARRYLDGREQIQRAIEEFAGDVRKGSFEPGSGA